MTLLELVIVAGMILTLASVAMPLSKLTQKRSREMALRQTLRETRNAIDRFHDDWKNDGPYCKNNQLSCKDRTFVSESGYPKRLSIMVEGVPLTGRVSEKRRKYLRRIPVDPITGEADWQIRCYKDGPDALISCDDDVYDIASKSDAIAIDGTEYRSW
jgi:general secretion pathway protein G